MENATSVFSSSVLENPITSISLREKAELMAGKHRAEALKNIYNFQSVEIESGGRFATFMTKVKHPLNLAPVSCTVLL